jgi:hypothetical protein
VHLPAIDAIQSLIRIRPNIEWDSGVRALPANDHVIHGKSPSWLAQLADTARITLALVESLAVEQVEYHICLAGTTHTTMHHDQSRSDSLAQRKRRLPIRNLLL